MYEDAEDIYLAVLRSWVSDASAYTTKLRNVTAETLKDYAVSMHGMKGTSASIGAEAIREKAKELEGMAKVGNIAGVQAENELFLKQVDSLVKDIQNWLKHR